jgi:hypothetical protein
LKEFVTAVVAVIDGGDLARAGNREINFIVGDRNKNTLFINDAGLYPCDIIPCIGQCCPAGGQQYPGRVAGGLKDGSSIIILFSARRVHRGRF